LKKKIIKKERKKKTMTGIMNGKSINTINNLNKKMKQNNQLPKKHIRVLEKCVRYEKLGYSTNLKVQFTSYLL